MIFKVGILGTGRMGLEVAALLSSSDKNINLGMELADAISETKKITSIEGISVRKLSEPPRETVHVWIDFSHPEATLQLLEGAITPVVVGTTGFSKSQFDSLKKFSSRVPVLFAPNLSEGMGRIKRMISTLPPQCAEIILSEAHHRTKKDSPSGTAKELQLCLSKKSTNEIPIHSTRAGSILGTHSVHFVFQDEEITLTHRVNHRRVFARGALVAAKFLIGKTAGLYLPEDVTP